MKNLKYYNDDCFAIYKEAISNKNDNESKRVLISVENKVERQYGVYLDKFQNKKIYEVVSDNFSDVEKDVLIDLYQYKSSIIKKIKKKILDRQVRTINATCQYCTLNSVNSLDHFIPKADFPEFSVNPLNLFPCCPECNSKKNNFCFIGKESLFLNLYLDELPEKEYLRAEFDFADEIPLVTFSLHNPDNIEVNLYRTICNHYGRLNLLERMREKSNEIITEIIRALKTNYKLNNDVEFLKTFIEDEEKENKDAYGFNHWKSILRLSIIQYAEFWKKYIVNT